MKYTFRKLINDIHLWLGIGSGLFLFILALTGTILVFENDIKSSLNKAQIYSDKNGEPMPLNQIIEMHETDSLKVSGLIVYGQENKNYQLTLDKVGSNESGKRSRGKRITVNPYNGQLVETKKSGEFLHSMEQLHRFLLMDPNWGRPITGAATLIFVILSFTGLVLWFPKKLTQFKRWNIWKQGLRIKTKGSKKRLNHDLHNVLGFYALIPLLLMGLSGLMWSYKWYSKGLENVLGDQLGKARFESVIPIEGMEDSSYPNIDLGQLLAKTDSIIPSQTEATRINLPKNPGETVLIRKKKAGFFAVNAADNIQFNPYTNEVVSISYFKDKNIGAKAAYLIRSIHVGDFGGTFTKIIYFIATLIATSLPITGVIIWINKLKKKKKRLKKA